MSKQKTRREFLAVGAFGPLAVAMLCLTVGALSAEMKDDIAAWTSRDVQGRTVEERMRLLDGILQTTGNRPNPQFLKEVFLRDAAVPVKKKAFEAYIARFAGDWKMLSRLSEWFPEDLLADYELTNAAKDIVVRHTEKNAGMRRRTATFIVMVLENMPYPQVPPAGGKIKVAYRAGVDRRKRPIMREATLDAAQAGRARALFEKGLADLNRIARTDFKPSPDVQGKIEAWWKESGQGWLFVAQEEWARIQASGYATIKSPEPARVVAATYLGTKGTEWLAGGGFQADGTVVAAGTCLGPSFEFPGVTVKVLGPDGPAPGEPAAEPHPRHDQTPFCWMHGQGTPFVLRLSADLKTIASATRLPWRSGAVTSAAVDDAGQIYLAGPARKGLRGVSPDAKDLGPAKAFPPPETRRGQEAGAPAPHVWESAYLAKLTPSADRVAWIRFVDNPNKCENAPEVSQDARGRLQFTSCDLRILDTEGNELERRDPSSLGSLPGRYSRFHPERPWQVTAHEHHWPTGHEPWRCPYVAIRNLDGSRHLTLYDWPGPFVGEATRRVADSFFYGFRFDRQGDLLLQGRCDGGNTVLLCEPMDVLRGAEAMKGLGYNAGGVGATCITFLIRVSTNTWTVTGGSMFPPGAVVEDAVEATDGSLLMICGGGNLKLTDNHLSTGLPKGPYILVTNARCDTHRFCSSMLGCGAARVGHTDWGIVSGTSRGRPMAMFLTGATEKAKVFDWEFPVPSANALQKDFAGGALDGHLTVLDLGQ